MKRTHEWNRLLRAPVAVAILASFLLGCQTFGEHQYTVTAVPPESVVQILSTIATSHGMTDCSSSSKAVGAIACYREGEMSFTFLGARTKGDLVIIDVSFRSAGIGGGLFDELNVEIPKAFRAQFGAQALNEAPPGKLIPIEHRP